MLVIELGDAVFEGDGLIVVDVEDIVDGLIATSRDLALEVVKQAEVRVLHQISIGLVGSGAVFHVNAAVQMIAGTQLLFLSVTVDSRRSELVPLDKRLVEACHSVLLAHDVRLGRLNQELLVVPQHVHVITCLDSIRAL